MRYEEYVSFDGTGLAELISSGDVAAGEVVSAAIDRIEATNPTINAVVATSYERALQRVDNGAPHGPFAGVPFLVKDLIDVAGMATGKGSRSMRWYVADGNDPLVDRQLAAGLVVVGKSATPELGLTPYTEPVTSGPTRNPWDPNRSPGGSSGGAAAAVAAGMVPMAHGGDGGGSIRIPASNCGLFGLKPSRGRVPSGMGVTDTWFGMVQSHVLCRSVRDSAAMLDLTHGAMVGDDVAAPPIQRPFRDEVGADPGVLRIGVLEGGVFHDDIDPECRAAVDGAARLLEELGHEVDIIDLPIDRERLQQAFLAQVAAVVAQTIAEIGEQSRSKALADEFELSTWATGLVGSKLGALDLADALAVRAHASQTMGAVMERHDVVVTSTLAAPPLEIGALQPAPSERRLLQVLRRVPAKPALMAAFRQMSQMVLAPIPNTPLFNLTGQPAMSVPLHWTKTGLPVGVQFAARYGDEATLFRLAAQLEKAAPWFDRMPSLVVSR